MGEIVYGMIMYYTQAVVERRVWDRREDSGAGINDVDGNVRTIPERLRFRCSERRSLGEPLFPNIIVDCGTHSSSSCGGLSST